MKAQYLTTLLVFILPFAIIAQSFEGTLIYVQDVFVPKNNIFNTSREKFLEEKKTDTDWYDTMKISYKGGNYFMTTNSQTNIHKVYNAENNTLYGFYNFMLTDEICSVQKAVDHAAQGAEKPIIQKPDSTFKINQYTCKMIRIKWQKNWIEYYYSTDVCKINSELFTQHAYERFNEFLKISGVLPVRIVTGYRGLKFLSTLSKIQSGKVNPEIFKIPELVDAPEYAMMQSNGVQIFRVKK